MHSVLADLVVFVFDVAMLVTDLTSAAFRLGRSVVSSPPTAPAPENPHAAAILARLDSAYERKRPFLRKTARHGQVVVYAQAALNECEYLRLVTAVITEGYGEVEEVEL